VPESKRFARQTAPLAARWCLFNLAPLYKTQQLTAMALHEIREKLTVKKRAAFQKRHSRSLVAGIAYAIVSELEWVVDAIMGWV
jgi:hypothetical protein